MARMMTPMPPSMTTSAVTKILDPSTLAKGVQATLLAFQFPKMHWRWLDEEFRLCTRRRLSETRVLSIFRVKKCRG